MSLRERISVVLAGAIVLTAVPGCVTQARARAQAEAAYAAGQQQALANLGTGENQARLVTVIGNVRVPVLPWSPDLTLARVIVISEYQDSTAPQEIFIVRQGRAIRTTAEDLLKGEDILLQPGDVIQLGRR